jgi:hypothetical protein
MAEEICHHIKIVNDERSNSSLCGEAEGSNVGAESQDYGDPPALLPSLPLLIRSQVNPCPLHNVSPLS